MEIEINNPMMPQRECKSKWVVI